MIKIVECGDVCDSYTCQKLDVFSSSSGEVKDRLPQTDNQQEK